MRLVTWLDNDSRITRGTRLTLKAIPGVDWIVTEVYDTLTDERYFHRKWEVGGLDPAG